MKCRIDMLKVFMTMAKFVNYYETNFITLAKKMGFATYTRRCKLQ